MAKKTGFIGGFWKAYKLGGKHRFLAGIIPYKFLLCIVIPFLILYKEVNLKNISLSDGEIVSILSAILVIGGFLGSATMSAMIRIHDIISKFPFSNFLRSIDIFDLFIFWPKYIYFECNIDDKFFCRFDCRFYFR